MDARRFAVGTLAGTLALYALGYVIFDRLFADFYAANVGSATGVDRSDRILWAMVLANAAYAVLIMYAMGQRGGAMSVTYGGQVGAIVGFLIWCTVDFVFYGSTNIANLTRTLVDPLLEIVHGGVSGMVIAAVLSRVPATKQGEAS